MHSVEGKSQGHFALDYPVQPPECDYPLWFWKVLPVWPEKQPQLRFAALWARMEGTLLPPWHCANSKSPQAPDLRPSPTVLGYQIPG